MSSPSSPQSNTSPPVSEASADRKAGGVVNLPKDRFERVDLLEADPSADSDKSGQLGLTYRAFDRRLGRPVVVRSLAGTDAVSLYQLRQPLSRLRKIFHENLALVLDASLIGKQPFIVRDYLAGEGLMDAFRQAVEAQDHGRAAGWLAQVLEGLQVLERHGLSHGHVVAPNLRLVEGRVLLLDGGLRPGSPADDLIALTYLVKAYVDPLSPQTQGPWRHLAALDPSSGDPVKSLGRELRDLIGSFDLAPAASPILLDRPFVGREPELMKIHQAAMKTRRGQSVTMLVEGSPGLGRSALLAKSKRLIEERHGDALVLSAGCRRKTRDRGAMDALLLDLVERLNQLPAREVEVVLPARPRELTAGFPVFLRLESAATASS